MSGNKHSLWWSYGLSAAVVLITLLVVAWFAKDRVYDFFIQHMRDELQSRAITVDQAIKGPGISSANCKVLAISDPDMRVTIINTAGVVLCDSTADSTAMDNHGDRPEVSRALAGQKGAKIRFSTTLQTSMLYHAMPRYESGKITAAIRTALPLTSINDLLDQLYRQFLFLLLVMLAVICIAVVYSYRKVHHPLQEITDKANDMAQGDLNISIPDYDITEIAELGDMLNHMARQLNRLENLRQDFVANVSHELKTPVATIKGYVETLLDGSEHSPDDLDNFLRIVHKQNDRLADIVDDLLTLSRLESAPAAEILDLHEHDACDLLKSSADSCQARADAKGITFSLDCDSPMPVRIDYSLMTQAMVNLIDNAIKYSHPNTRISLSVDASGGQIHIGVCDQGPGIPEQHISRLFERFYRIDKSRSRRIGGTGLGLAIVKHIIQVHEGRVKVVNNRGAGCCFIIDLEQNT
ncbi:MAG: ATP-binding protein [Gammaproteobacteria bacterium]|nr:ATP-binding protein [Gammaproteobacteria bacterium]